MHLFMMVFNLEPILLIHVAIYQNVSCYVLQQTVPVGAYIPRCVSLLINAAVLMAIKEITVKWVQCHMYNNVMCTHGIILLQS